MTFETNHESMMQVQWTATACADRKHLVLLLLQTDIMAYSTKLRSGSFVLLGMSFLSWVIALGGLGATTW